jgi:hypothetical protein
MPIWGWTLLPQKPGRPTWHKVLSTEARRSPQATRYHLACSIGSVEAYGVETVPREPTWGEAAGNPICQECRAVADS